MKYSIVIAAAALVIAAPLAAQHKQHSQQQQAGIMQHCMMMSGASPAALLQHRESLGLSATQVTRLETLNARTHGSVMPHMQPATQAHTAAAEMLRADRPDFAAYEARIREAADHMVRTHVEMARVAVEARQVLTPEQRTRLDTMRDGMMRDMHQRMMQGGQGGMMEGMQMGGGMMMPCMSPGAAAGGGAHRH
jgi:Spy/CpxP family protein refolding chaperone